MNRALIGTRSALFAFPGSFQQGIARTGIRAGGLLRRLADFATRSNDNKRQRKGTA
jgi:hypothetical protein